MKKFLNIIFPKRCPGCDEIMDMSLDKAFCKSCEERIERLSGCEHKKNLLCLYSYEGVMKKSMYRLKYSNRRCYVKSLFSDEETYFSVKAFIEKNDIDAVIPVPMFKGKERLRGYNQAGLISRYISKEFNIREDRDLVIRVRETKALKAMSPAERTNNLKNAFKIRGNAVKWKKILVADDIYTTGATLSAVASALYGEGVKDVYALCLCGSKRITGD